MHKYVTAIALLSFSACTHMMATPAGEAVAVLQVRRPQGCKSLGTLEGVASGSLMYGDALESFARNDLQNRAAKLGATHVRIDAVTPSAHECRIDGEAFICPAGAPLL